MHKGDALSQAEVLTAANVPYLPRSGIEVDSVATVDTLATVYNFEVADFHTYFVGRQAIWVHNYCLVNNSLNIVESFKRTGSPDMNLFEGIPRPNSNKGDGLIHILERHSDPTDFFPLHEKEDLFPKGTTIDQVVDAIKEVYAKGARGSVPTSSVQTFRKRIKLNGESANYLLAVDNPNGKIITFFKIGQ